MNRSTFGMKYMNGLFSKGQVYEWGRFWNTGSHTRTKITPVTPLTPKLGGGGVGASSNV